MRILLALCLALFAFVAPAHAGDLKVRIVDASGTPVTDAVVTVKPAAGVPAGPIRFLWGTTMIQKDIEFVPHVLIVPVGATVRFPNKDKVRHHIYSFSKPAHFEMKLYGRDESRSYTFKTAGAVALGCNIHDRMSGFIKVVDTPFAAKSDATGMLTIAGLPAGRATLTVWHERLRARDNETSFDLTVPPDGTLSKQITVQLR